MRTSDALAAAAGFGVLAGMRSLSAPALLGRELSRPRGLFGRHPFQDYALRRGARALTVLAAGELAADKAPFTPPRTRFPVLAARIASGAITGATLARRERRPVLGFVLVGAAAALASSYAFYGLRRLATRRLRLPNVAAGFLEDSLAFLLSSQLRTALR
jgi:uncharacterized membrane protein